jgi:hypothetical protein
MRMTTLKKFPDKELFMGKAVSKSLRRRVVNLLYVQTVYNNDHAMRCRGRLSEDNIFDSASQSSAKMIYSMKKVLGYLFPWIKWNNYTHPTPEPENYSCSSKDRYFPYLYLVGNIHISSK